MNVHKGLGGTRKGESLLRLLVLRPHRREVAVTGALLRKILAHPGSPGSSFRDNQSGHVKEFPSGC